MYEAGDLPVVVEAVYPFTDQGVKDAFAHLDTGRTRGKVVVKVD